MKARHLARDRQAERIEEEIWGIWSSIEAERM